MRMMAAGRIRPRVAARYAIATPWENPLYSHDRRRVLGGPYRFQNGIDVAEVVDDHGFAVL